MRINPGIWECKVIDWKRWAPTSDSTGWVEVPSYGDVPEVYKETSTPLAEFLFIGSFEQARSFTWAAYPYSPGRVLEFNRVGDIVCGFPVVEVIVC